MSEKDDITPRRWPLLTALLVAVIAAGFLGWLTRPSQSHYNPQAYETRDEAKPYSVFVPLGHESTENGTTRQYNEDDREQWVTERSDLAAQWRTADVAHVGLWIGAVGLIFIAWTLIETRGAAKSAQDTLRIARDTLSATERATKAEFQPYISIDRLRVPIVETESSEFDGIIDGEGHEPEFCVHRVRGDINLTPKIKVTNTGKVPARELFCLAAAELHYNVWDEDAGQHTTGYSQHVRSIQQYFAHQINSGGDEAVAIPMCFKTGINPENPTKEEVGLFGIRLEVGIRISWVDDFSAPKRRVVIATFSDVLDGGCFEPIGFIETTAEEYDDPDYWNEQDSLVPLGIYGPNVMRDIGRRYETRG